MAEHARGAENGRSKSRDKIINLLENEEEELQKLKICVFFGLKLAAQLCGLRDRNLKIRFLTGGIASSKIHRYSWGQAMDFSFFFQFENLVVLVLKLAGLEICELSHFLAKKPMDKRQKIKPRC